MSKTRTPVYLLIAALSLAVAVWQPRDAVSEHAGKVARVLQLRGPLQVLVSSQPTHGAGAGFDGSSR